jgi:hypothetical protein
VGLLKRGRLKSFSCELHIKEDTIEDPKTRFPPLYTAARRKTGQSISIICAREFEIPLGRSHSRAWAKAAPLTSSPSSPDWREGGGAESGKPTKVKPWHSETWDLAARKQFLANLTRPSTSEPHALDGCDSEGDVRMILQLLTESRTLKTVRLLVFLTSRPEIPMCSLRFSGFSS